MTARPAEASPQVVHKTRWMARLPTAVVKSLSPRGRLLLLAGLGVALALLLYYPVGAWRADVVDDDIGFAPLNWDEAPSRSVALAAALIRREIDVHGWTPNKPFFMPAAILDDMPNFQMGVIAAIGRFALEMDEEIGRSPEAAAGDPDLGRAAGLLQYPPNVWMVDPAVPWTPTISTEKQYRNAARAFEAYNQRLRAGTASFARRPEALAAVLGRFAKDLDGAAAKLEATSRRGGGWFAWQADDAYYAAKGRAYAMLLLLGGLARDFEPALSERNLGQDWQAMLDSLTVAATAQPWVVLAGGPASTFVPDHPALLGFQLLRTRGRLDALADALR